MKLYITFTAIMLLMAVQHLKAQLTTVFSENFDGSTVNMTSSGSPGWTTNTALQVSGTKSFHGTYNTLGNAAILQSPSINCSGNNYVIIEFDQICKSAFIDHCEIEVSINGGNWTTVTGNYYTGWAGAFPNTNWFSHVDYFDWDFNNPQSIPANTWWKHELLDISHLAASQGDVRVRFKLQGNSSSLPSPMPYGWLIDNIEVKMQPCYPDDPEIILPDLLWTGDVFQNTGPFEVIADFTSTGSIASGKIHYSVNNGSWQFVNMSHVNNDRWSGFIPQGSANDVICWYVSTTDNNNCSENFPGNPHCFTLKNDFTFPYCENFEGKNSFLWSSSPASNSAWEHGMPAYGATSGVHSGNYAWDIDLSSGYTANAVCDLISPVYDFTGLLNPSIEFYLNYNVSQNDGIQMHYKSAAQSTWTLLGAQSTDNAIAQNWYDGAIPAGEAWTGNSAGWKQCKFMLGSIAGINNDPSVQFRFQFTSDNSGQFDGVSLDDFCITVPAANDAGISAIISPVNSYAVGSSVPVQAKLVNYGSSTQTAVTIKATTNNNVTATYSWTGSLPGGNVSIITFPSNITMPSGTNYFCVKTELTGDVVPTNDFKCKSVSGVTPMNLKAGDVLVTLLDESGFQLKGYNVLNPLQNGAVQGQIWTPPLQYESSSWDYSSLGPVYGVTSLYENFFDLKIYVSSFRFYGGGGNDIDQIVYKIDGSTGAVEGSVVLPGSGSQFGLGNICADQEHQQLFVSNLYDGKIYRLSNNLQILSSYDPFGQFVSPQFSHTINQGIGNQLVFGEMILGVGYFNNRLYFSQWNEDSYDCVYNWAVGSCSGKGHCANGSNTIWSIAIDNGGEFSGTPQGEINVPSLDGTNYSNPVTDIKFNNSGQMLLGERSIYRFAESSSQGRVLRYHYLPQNQGLTFEQDYYGNLVQINTPGWYLTPSQYSVDDGSLYSGAFYCIYPEAAGIGGVAWGLDGNIYATGTNLVPFYTANEVLDGFAIIPPTGSLPSTAANDNIYVPVYNDPNDNLEGLIGDIYVIPNPEPCPTFAGVITSTENCCVIINALMTSTVEPPSDNFEITVNGQTYSYVLAGDRIEHCFEPDEHNTMLDITLTYVGNNGCRVDTTFTILPCPEEPPCESCIQSFAPVPGRNYIVSAWAKEDAPDNDAITYDNPELYIEYLQFSNGQWTIFDTEGPFTGKGQIIDGWQRIEEKFTINSLAMRCRVRLASDDGPVYFDDIRVFPEKGTIKTFAYDPVSLKLAAELDERNYATFYEYDEEGKLSRIKKETERGIMTIQETKASLPKP